MRKPSYGQGSKGPRDPRPPASGEFSGMPRLWEFLTHTAYEDGSPRRPGSVSFFFEDGQFKACLSDRQEGYLCFKSGDGILDLLDKLEAGLEAATLEWRQPTGKPKR